MRVAFLTQYYPPEMGAPQTRISEFAQGLLARGWQVSVVTALPNYPGGRVFEAYRGRRYVREEVDGIDVRRTWIRPNGSSQVAARLLTAVSFAVSCTIEARRLGRSVDAFVVESPPLTMGPVGAIAARACRAAYVLNVSDLWPGSLVDMGVLCRPGLIRAAERVEAMSYRAATLITAQSPDIVSSIERRFPRSSVRLLSNGVDTSVFNPSRRSRAWRDSLCCDGDVLVTYAGLHGLAQGLGTVLEAAERLRGESRIRFLFVGDGPAKADLVRQARQQDLTNVRFMPPVPHDAMPNLLASSDIAVITLARPILGAIPSKVYEAMASGVPVVAATGGGADDLIRSVGAGVVVEPGDADELARAVAHLAKDADMRARCGMAGRELACGRFDRRVWIDHLAGYLEEAIAARAGVAHLAKEGPICT